MDYKEYSINDTFKSSFPSINRINSLIDFKKLLYRGKFLIDTCLSISQLHITCYYLRHLSIRPCLLRVLWAYFCLQNRLHFFDLCYSSLFALIVLERFPIFFIQYHTLVFDFSNNLRHAQRLQTVSLIYQYTFIFWQLLQPFLRIILRYR